MAVGRVWGRELGQELVREWGPVPWQVQEWLCEHGQEQAQVWGQGLEWTCLRQLNLVHAKTLSEAWAQEQAYVLCGDDQPAGLVHAVQWRGCAGPVREQGRASALEGQAKV